jgi:hypothetical protein
MIERREFIQTLSLPAISYLEHKDHPKKFANKKEPISAV